MSSNIQVVVRCRGRNSREIAANSPVLVYLPNDSYSVTNPTVSIQQSQQLAGMIDSKVYTVDQVYGPQADQELVFEKVARPLFIDFVEGYNVTILAYGQTGTGKTYTMCGDCNYDVEEGTIEAAVSLGEMMGIIPRILNELFKTLDEYPESDYVVKCSFVELYNEELKDLLADDSDRDNLPLRIYEQKKGGGSSMIIQNLLEKYITNTKHGLDILKKGVNKRKTASTKMNNVSSRSHTIFTINLHKKQEDNSYKISKINLVDLAGSENINRSGAINQRAREAGLINQSLLTLGRVINSLSDKNQSATSHIPYRESKLTRLLQDSIGGKTKTALIATISPAKINIEETVSTLEYASRAKNIQNKPQQGGDSNSMLKKILLKDMAKEITKLNSDLIATRSKNGIWMDEQNYNNLIEQNELLKLEIKETKSLMEALNSKLIQLNNQSRNSDKIILAMKTQVNEYQNKIKTSEEKESTFKERLSREQKKNLELDEKLEELIKLIDEYEASKVRFHTMMDDNLTSSLRLIDDIVVEIKRNSSSESGKIQNTVEKIDVQLKRLKDGVRGTVSTIREQFDNSSAKIPEVMNHIKLTLESFDKQNDRLATSFDQRFSQFNLTNEEFAKYVHEKHLVSTRLEELISHLVQDDLGKKMQSVYENLIQLISELLRGSKDMQQQLIDNSLEKFVQLYIKDEKDALVNECSKIHESSTNFRSSFVSDIQVIKENTTETKAQASERIDNATNTYYSLLSECLEPNLARVEESISNSSLETATSGLATVKNSIALNERRMFEYLTDFKGDLDAFKSQLSSKNPMDMPKTISKLVKHDGHSELNRIKLSPSKIVEGISSKESSPKKFSSRKASPLKRHSSSTLNRESIRSKIPKINRTMSDRENLASSYKKRRVLHDIENNSQ